jgi:hypothetical protein
VPPGSAGGAESSYELEGRIHLFQNRSNREVAVPCPRREFLTPLGQLRTSYLHTGRLFKLDAKYGFYTMIESQ